MATSCSRSRFETRVRQLASVLALLLLLGACGDDGDGGAPAGSGETLVVTLGGQAITWSPVFIADCLGLFADNGLDVDVQISDGPTAVAALLSGETILAGTGAPSTINAQREGAPVRMLMTVSAAYGVQIVASNEWLDETGTSLSAPLAERVRAMEGYTGGIQSPGGADDQFYRYLLQEHDLDPDRDFLLQSLSNYNNQVAAIRQGSIDFLAGSPPNGQRAEGEGIGRIYIDPSEIDGLSNYPYLTLSARDRDIEERPETLHALVRTVAAALAEMRSGSEAARTCVREEFSDLDDATFDRAYEFVASIAPDDPTITEERYEALATFAERQGNPFSATYDELVAHEVARTAMSQ